MDILKQYLSLFCGSNLLSRKSAITNKIGKKLIFKHFNIVQKNIFYFYFDNSAFILNDI